MLTYLYEWIENIAFYMVIITVAMQMIPNDSYKKYIRFFTGLILIIMLAGPIMKIFGVEQELQEFYKSAEYQQKVKEIERATKYLEEFSGETE
ncbi:MAG: stage III sporulation protein AF [Tyzzerella sp.]|nr:stage III sporulation protein AF [Tyzzerella sp.]